MRSSNVSVSSEALSLYAKYSSSGNKKLYKRKKKEYHLEKKRIASELVQTFKDPTVVLIADWLKIRGALHKWMRVFCLLKPGLFIIYKNAKTDKSGHWIGTVLLSSCELIERPSKKGGFCFKLYHPMDQSIWAARGPKGESFGAVTQPLPTSHLICRAPSDDSGTCWMDALELALKCNRLLLKTLNKQLSFDNDLEIEEAMADEKDANESVTTTENKSDFDDELMSDFEEKPDENIVETVYRPAAAEVFAELGESSQVEEVEEENKSLIWTLMKQVRPGMDLSKVVLPTFILEPRSFLEKLADYYYHSDLLSEAAKENHPYRRMEMVVKFYLSGFYKKPKGMKKPYNPILGEAFRCYWDDTATGSRTFYVAEQVSHHPPVSAFFVTNRKSGFNVSGSILAKSKFYGNSLSAIMCGGAKITLLNQGETYTITLPYAHCKGLLFGTLTMQLGGFVTITCDRTSYYTELEFKLKPLLGGPETFNLIEGKIKLGKTTISQISGRWDSTITITSLESMEKRVLWEADESAMRRRLVRYDVDFDQQEPFESQKLWIPVTEAIRACDQKRATDEKTKIEDIQRQRARELLSTGRVHSSRLFDFDPNVDNWSYKFADYRPWDPENDVAQYESNFIVKTKALHRIPIISTSSVQSAPVRCDWSDEEEEELGSDVSPKSKEKIKDATDRGDAVQVEKKSIKDILRDISCQLEILQSDVAVIQDKLQQRVIIFSDPVSISLLIAFALFVLIFFVYYFG